MGAEGVGGDAGGRAVFKPQQTGEAFVQLERQSDQRGGGGCGGNKRRRLRQSPRPSAVQICRSVIGARREVAKRPT